MGLVTRVADPAVPEGTVTAQDPEEGQLVNGGTPIALTISAGSNPGFVVEPGSMAFGSQALGTVSSPRTVKLTNTSSSNLGPWSIALTGVDASQFLHTHSCPASLSAGQSCDISVAFRPSVTGLKSASLTVGTEPAGAQSVALSGSGVRATYSVSRTTINFGSVKRNNASAPVNVLVSNTGGVVLPITSITLSGDNPRQFAQTNNCGVEVAVGATCTVSVTFKPTTTGSKSAKLVITPGGGAPKKTVALSGTGT